MVKVLHILNALLPSGAETMLKVAGSYWDKKYEHHVLSTAKEVGVYAPELEKAGYHIHHIYHPRKWSQFKEIKAFMKKEQFDIVHVHREGSALELEWMAKRAGTKNIVRTVHSAFQFNGQVRLRRIITRNLGVKLGVKHVAISQSVLENEKKRFHIDCILVRNWYDENKFHFADDETKRKAREKLGVQPDEICMVSVGSCYGVKNHMSVFRALVDSCPKNLVYFHVGSGKDEEKEKQFVKENHLESVVRFEGFQDPRLYLEAADLYVMPSLFEGAGISAMEAMAVGVPTLFTDVYGLWDFKAYHLPDTEYCSLDEDDLREKLLAMLEKCPSMQNSREKSEKMREFHGIEQGVKGYQEVYEA